MRRYRVESALVSFVILSVACGGSSTTTDAGVDAAVGMDGPDAFQRCGANVELLGEYVDWDSTVAMFKGVAMATLQERGQPGNMVMTPPNGRSTLCIAPNVDTIVDATHPDYLPVAIEVDARAVARGPFSLRGLTPERGDTLFDDEVGASRDPAKAIVLVEVRQQSSGQAVVGASISLTGAGHGGAFTAGADGKLARGSATTHDAYVLFANVETAAPLATVAVDVPGSACTGKATVGVATGTVTFVHYTCD